MLKLIQKHLDSKLIKLSLVFSFIYCLLFNSAVIVYKFSYYKFTFFKAILELSKDSIYICFTCFIIFFGLTIHRLVFIIGAIFLFVTGAIASYYLYLFKISPTKEMMGSFFSTDFNEVYEIVSIRLIVWLIFSIATCIYTMKHFSILDSKLFVTKLLAAICLLITINNIIMPQFNLLRGYFPIQYLHNTYLSLNNKRSAMRDDISKKFSFIDQSDQNITVVLVIGESARFDHFGINGYHRDTTPYLSSVENLFSFKAQSASNHTHLSVPSLLSRHPASSLDKSTEETSFLSIFTMLGFNTNWIGTQNIVGYLRSKNPITIYDEVRFTMIPGGSILLRRLDHDGKMLPHIENNIVNSTTKNVLVIHTAGSHWKYSARYPKEFQKFTPKCNSITKVDQSSCDIEELINDYDNTILYTDFFLYNVIDLLKNSNAILIYVSDHAESLGEHGYYGHGGPMIPEQTTVPFLVWISDEFKKRHPDLVSSIANHLGTEISHDYVFHSILNCVGIHSAVIDKNLSLCSKQRLNG
ncbi:phosphoethanolamine transferase [Candidatus Tisiphia endosymbiont of Dascillus cervinus]|uniref:phosphoethanolamine transferase n=1 Tax=Candidatus Tisiphia endosymbiont of Dascillus cervinus TaxID=3066253 RepID=UPI00312CA4C4